MQRDSLIAGLSLKRPVTVVMILLCLTVIGLIAYNKIPILLEPDGATAPFLMLWTGYPNSSPREIEKQITEPIEDMLETVSGVRNTFSTTGSDGVFIFIAFNSNVDMKVAYDDVRDRIDRVRPDLPSDLDRIYLWKRNPKDTPVMWLGAKLPESVSDPHYFFESRVLKHIERVDGVAKVEYGGVEAKSIHIDLISEKLKSHNISVYELVRKLRNSNFTMPGGEIHEKGGRVSIRSLAQFKSLEEIGNEIAAPSGIRLKDIADIRYDTPERRRITRVDGEEALSVAIYKESTTNTVEICERLKTLLEEDLSEDSVLKDVDFHIFFNQGELIMDSINTLKETGIYGGIFAFFVLLFFLRRVMMTIVICFAIPSSIFIAVTVMYFRGESINVVSLMGLMLAVGMVVDNSIVLVENITRSRKECAGTAEAALKGASGVSLAITVATLTTLVVFLPLMLMFDDAMFRYMMGIFGLPICYALLASLFVALVFIPLVSTLIPESSEKKEFTVITKTNELLQKAVGWTLDHRVESVLIFLLLFSSTFVANGLLQKTDEMEGNIRDFQFRFILPNNFSLSEADEVMKRVEDIIFENKEEFDIKTVLTQFSATEGQARVFLDPPEESDVTVENAVDGIKQLIPEIAGVEMRIGWHRSANEGDASLTVRLNGKDTEVLSRLADEAERRIKGIPFILDIETDRERAKDEIVVKVDRELAGKQGVSSSVIASTVSFALRGVPLPEYRTLEREIDITFRLQEKDRENLEQLENLEIMTAGGTSVPLRTIASFSIQRGFGEITRINGKTSLEIKVNTQKDDLKSLYRAIDEKMEGFQMPYGYTWDKGDRFDRMIELGQTQQFAWVFSIVFVFLLMGVLFESFVLPLSVMFSIPFAFFGAFWSLVITRTPMDMIVGIGIVLLIGIVVNNAIVLVDLINQFRKEGMDRRKAIIEGTKHRFRPIIMTALTTIFGMVPMAVGKSTMVGIPFSPLGRAVIGGLVASTFSTLLLLPLFYTLMEDFGKLFRRFIVEPFFNLKPGLKSDD